MSESMRNGKNNTLLCLITIYVIHWILLSSGIKSITLEKVIIKNRTSSNIAFFNQTSHDTFAVKNKVKVYY